jgi:hypothetical protein
MENMETHVRVAAWLRIIWSAGGLLVALVVLLVFGGLSAVAGAAGGGDAPNAASWIFVVGSFISMIFGVLALPGLVTAWGLLTYRPWARVLDIALSAFDLFHVPIGTALGAYSIWVMLQPETVDLFEGKLPPRRYPAHF